ncbi:hypothetical protein ACFSC1_11240 [Paracoccus aurantiacus]|uniref:hypothetical protein n=1 Tax=Paracoccus aurantiacus TaxID=2599412 RepID=UPI00164B7247|nr:hypothetical protein [Paracoccus aurantiacus]
MRRALLIASLLLLGCRPVIAADSLSLAFGSYRSSPVVLTHFSIEKPLAPTQRVIVSSDAERSMPRDDGRSSALSLPRDVDGDGYWTVRAEWVELQTDRAWRNEVKVPLSKLNVAYDMAMLTVIFGPNGLLLIGSDKPGNGAADRLNVAAECGQRVPASDHAWRNETGIFPEVADVLAYAGSPSGKANCPAPAG